MVRLHRFISVFLCLALVATGSAMSAARAGSGPGGIMVLCGGSGYQTIALDAEGLPTEHRHLCPDCALLSLTGVLPGMFLPALPVGVRSGRAAETSDRPGHGGERLIRVRGPPRAA